MKRFSIMHVVIMLVCTMLFLGPVAHSQERPPTKRQWDEELQKLREWVKTLDSNTISPDPDKITGQSSTNSRRDPVAEQAASFERLILSAQGCLAAHLVSLRQPLELRDRQTATLAKQVEFFQVVNEIFALESVTVPTSSAFDELARQMRLVPIEYPAQKFGDWSPKSALRLISARLDTLSFERYGEADATRDRMLKAAEGKKGKDEALALISEALAMAKEAHKQSASEGESLRKAIAAVQAKADELRKRHPIPELPETGNNDLSPRNTYVPGGFGDPNSP